MPPLKGNLEPGRLVQHAPVDDCHEERQRRDCGVEERVEGLKGSWERLEECFAAQGVCERVNGRGEEVEAEAPEGYDGEVGE